MANRVAHSVGGTCDCDAIVVGESFGVAISPLG